MSTRVLGGVIFLFWFSAVFWSRLGAHAGGGGEEWFFSTRLVCELVGPGGRGV